MSKCYNKTFPIYIPLPSITFLILTYFRYLIKRLVRELGFHAQINPLKIQNNGKPSVSTFEIWQFSVSTLIFHKIMHVL